MKDTEREKERHRDTETQRHRDTEEERRGEGGLKVLDKWLGISTEHPRNTVH